jgi:hypothetical protein
MERETEQRENELTGVAVEQPVDAVLQVVDALINESVIAVLLINESHVLLHMVSRTPSGRSAARIFDR